MFLLIGTHSALSPVYFFHEHVVKSSKGELIKVSLLFAFQYTEKEEEWPKSNKIVMEIYMGLIGG